MVGRGAYDQGGIKGHIIKTIKADVFGMLTDISVFILMRNAFHSWQRGVLLHIIKTHEKTGLVGQVNRD